MSQAVPAADAHRATTLAIFRGCSKSLSGDQKWLPDRVPVFMSRPRAKSIGMHTNVCLQHPVNRRVSAALNYIPIIKWLTEPRSITF
jgi:hypothetical protein